MADVSGWHTACACGLCWICLALQATTYKAQPQQFRHSFNPDPTTALRSQAATSGQNPEMRAVMQDLLSRAQQLKMTQQAQQQ